MARQTNVTEIMGDFPGLINNADERELPPGAAVELVNLAPRIPGAMRSRRGLRPVVFESTTLVALTATG